MKHVPSWIYVCARLNRIRRLVIILAGQPVMTDSLPISVHYLTNLDKAKLFLSLYLTNRPSRWPDSEHRTGSLIDIATRVCLQKVPCSVLSLHSRQKDRRPTYEPVGLSFPAGLFLSNNLDICIWKDFM